MFRLRSSPRLPDRQEVFVRLDGFTEKSGLFRERYFEEDVGQRRIVVHRLKPAAGDQFPPREAADELLEFTEAFEQFSRGHFGDLRRMREIYPVFVMLAHVSWPPSVRWRAPVVARNTRAIPRL